jgi:hypothetical protein
MTSKQIGEIAMILLSFRDQLKLYHWTTKSYSRHKASDKLVNVMTDQIDRFMETLQGSRNNRILLTSKSAKIKFVNQKDENAIELLEEFKIWLLNGLSKILKPTDTDLYSIRDEMLSIVNQTIYLFSLSL